MAQYSGHYIRATRRVKITVNAKEQGVLAGPAVLKMPTKQGVLAGLAVLLSCVYMFHPQQRTICGHFWHPRYQAMSSGIVWSLVNLLAVGGVHVRGHGASHGATRAAGVQRGRRWPRPQPQARQLHSDADGGWFDVLARASPTVHGGLPHPPEWAVKLCKYHSDRVGFRCGNIAAAVLIPRNAAPATLGCSLL